MYIPVVAFIMKVISDSLIDKSLGVYQSHQWVYRQPITSSVRNVEAKVVGKSIFLRGREMFDHVETLNNEVHGQCGSLAKFLMNLLESKEKELRCKFYLTEFLNFAGFTNHWLVVSEPLKLTKKFFAETSRLVFDPSLGKLGLLNELIEYQDIFKQKKRYNLYPNFKEGRVRELSLNKALSLGLTRNWVKGDYSGEWENSSLSLNGLMNPGKPASVVISEKAYTRERIFRLSPEQDKYNLMADINLLDELLKRASSQGKSSFVK